MTKASERRVYLGLGLRRSAHDGGKAEGMVAGAEAEGSPLKPQTESKGRPGNATWL